MDTNDGIENVEPENSQGVSIVGEAGQSDGVHQSIDASSSVAESLRTLDVSYGSNWAQLEVGVSWSADGRTFHCYSKRYRAGDNGNKKGNVYLQFGDWGEYELTSDDGIQDGRWRNLHNGGSTAANQSAASVRFRYMFDFSNAQDQDREITIDIPFVPAPPSVNPIRNVSSRTFTVYGTGGVYGAGTITLHNLIGYTITTANIQSNGNWTANVSMAATNSLVFIARQKIGEKDSSYSPSSTVYLAAITAPAPNSWLEPGVVFRGIGAPGTRMRTVRADNPNVQLAPEVMVKEDGTWEAPFTATLSSGPVSVQTQFNLAGFPPGSTASISYDVVLVPAITSPAANSVQMQTFTVNGDKGRNGATVNVYIDLSPIVVSKATVAANGTWSASVTVPIGPVPLVASQTYSGKESRRSAPRAFKIRPPVLTTVNVTFPSETSVKFSGNGHTGATVELTVVNGPPGGTAPPAVVVTGGAWETTATNWPFGTYSLRAIQKVADNANGWIESQPYTFSVTSQFPIPSDVIHTKDYQPTFSGKGLTGATVKLFNPDGVTPAAPDARVSNGVWSSKASTVWGPTLNREVRIKQFLNGQESPNWVIVKVTIPPLAPGLDDPQENGLSPQLSGTCWPGATLSLKYSDSATPHSVPSTNGVWSFRRDQPFAPEINHTVTITQTAAGQTSPAVSKTFMVYAPIPQPVITSPAANSEVGREMTVQGTSGMKGATMQLRDAQFDRKLGEPKSLTADGKWSIDLTGLEFRRYFIDAQQTRNQRPSVRSEPRTFDVVLLPPVITVPMENGDLPRTATLEGWAMPGGRVEIRLEGVAEPLLTNISVSADGRWKGEVTLPVGAKTIWARQTFDNQTSQDSPRLSYNVVPAAPFIETPAMGERIGRQVVVSGFGVPGDTVTVKLEGDAARTVLAQSPVLEDRTWSVAVEFDQPDGLYDVVAVASCDGFDSADSPGRPIMLGAYLPSIDVPAAGQWVSDPVRFEGQGRPGSGHVVSWFNPDHVWASNVPVTDGWQGGATQSLPRGGNWCRFGQTLTEGTAVSDWAESKRFEVLPPTSTQS